ncbi:TIGR03089 family protein [Cellulomonas sp. Sa3CUA2]|uniref:TIGR03089 family protein n=1 Tax=Cellulomonas avistercoris TaxID=2762242 RepID=A0ABR8QIH4_9CELL|nr:TIGR03089 family protein [Cellulomonas avistercoris]MBD7920223.1 TIGR03089 family protein [Cellulomonas avistercoris]
MPAASPATPPTSLEDVLALVQREPGRPRVTWYAVDGERVELSGAVLANWVTKTTNLLVEEFDAAPGTRVLVDLPAHWRTVVWCFAVWRAGACVVLPGATGPVDLVVTSEPSRHPGARDLVAVALPALARRWPGDLPAGAVDAASATMTYGDVLGFVAPRDPRADALDDGNAVVAHDALVRAALPPSRAVVTGDARTVVLRTLELLAGDGSAVVLDADVAADEVRRARLLEQERAGTA